MHIYFIKFWFQKVKHQRDCYWTSIRQHSAMEKKKPLPRRRAVQGPGDCRHSSAREGLTCQAQGSSSRQRCPYSSDRRERAPASAPSLQPRHSRACLGPGSRSASPSPALQALPSCAGSSSVCAEVTAQPHVWICRNRPWPQRCGCEVPSALAEVP